MERAEAIVRSACSSDPGEAVELLHGHAPDDHLAVACAAGNAGMVQALLDAGASPLAPTGPFGWAPISYTCFTRIPRLEPERAAGVRAVARALLQAGADPNTSFTHDDWRQAPVYGAAGILNDAELTRILLDFGADPNDNDEAHDVGEALYHAAEFEDPECATLLIEAGTHQYVADYCLGRALNFPFAELAEGFVAAGAQPDGGSVLQAVQRRRPVRTIFALLDGGGPVDPQDEQGVSAVRIAARWGEEAVATVLLDRGADGTAVTDGDLSLGEYLLGEREALDGGFDPVALGEMLGIAIAQGDLEITRRLLNAGAPLHRDGGQDPLGEACWRGQTEIVALLVGRGARLTFPGGGSALGAAHHGSQHCHHPEGGPTMRTVQEIDQAPYRAIVELLTPLTSRSSE